MYYPYTAGVAALSHFYFNPLYSPADTVYVPFSRSIILDTA